jgi:hypothetical protein
MKSVFINWLGVELSTLSKKDSFNSYAKNHPIEQVGENYYVTNRSDGIGFVFDKDKKLTAIHLYNGEKENIKAFVGTLPNNMSFDDDPQSVRSKIESIDYKTGGGENLPFLGKSNLWYRYNFEKSYLTVEFNQKNTIELITIGIKKMKPL